jgi:hypothetical protein
VTEIVIGVVALLATVFVAEGILERRRMAKHRTAIADCRDNKLAMIVGKVVPIQLVEAPVTKRSCVAFAVVGKLRHRRREKLAVTTFYVIDGTGRAIVEADETALELDMGPNLQGSRVARNVQERDSLGFGHVEALWEGALEEGATVAVFGEVQLLSVAGTTATSGYRDGHVIQVKIVRPRRGLFLISDRRELTDARPSV